jgi:hypothetical protein
MLGSSISPGDLICFELAAGPATIWKTYLAPGVVKDANGDDVWHEIKSGDIGIVVDSSKREFGSVIVLMSRINCLLKINTKRLRALQD